MSKSKKINKQIIKTLNDVVKHKGGITWYLTYCEIPSKYC